LASAGSKARDGVPGPLLAGKVHLPAARLGGAPGQPVAFTGEKGRIDDGGRVSLLARGLDATMNAREPPAAPKKEFVPFSCAHFEMIDYTNKNWLSAARSILVENRRAAHRGPVGLGDLGPHHQATSRLTTTPSRSSRLIRRRFAAHDDERPRLSPRRCCVFDDSVKHGDYDYPTSARS
jgi:hypothetical protein